MSSAPPFDEIHVDIPLPPPPHGSPPPPQHQDGSGNLPEPPPQPPLQPPQPHGSTPTQPHQGGAAHPHQPTHGSGHLSSSRPQPHGLVTFPQPHQGGTLITNPNFSNLNLSGGYPDHSGTGGHPDHFGTTAPPYPHGHHRPPTPQPHGGNTHSQPQPPPNSPNPNFPPHTNPNFLNPNFSQHPPPQPTYPPHQPPYPYLPQPTYTPNQPLPTPLPPYPTPHVQYPPHHLITTYPHNLPPQGINPRPRHPPQPPGAHSQNPNPNFYLPNLETLTLNPYPIGSHPNGPTYDHPNEPTYSYGHDVPDTSTPQHPHLALTAVTNIKSNIPITLSLTEPNYKKWKRLFLLLVRRFNLFGFIDGTAQRPPYDDSAWLQLDSTIQGWIFNTIADDVADLLTATYASTASLWSAVANLFLDNQQARAMQLGHQFRTTKKGSLTISQYCQTMKNLSDQLADVNAPVSEDALTLQVLQGLPKSYTPIVTVIPLQKPMPTFHETRNSLQLFENRLAETDTAPPTALFTTPSRSSTTSYRDNHNNRGRGRGRGRGSGRNSYRHNLNPNAYPQHSSAPGLLGPNPPGQAHLTQPNQPASNPPTYSYPPASFDPNVPTALAATLNNLQQPAAEWYMDSGATHHISANAGTLTTISNSSINTPPHIIVGNGSAMPITQTGTHTLSQTPPLTLNNVVVSPNIVTNLISVRKFCRENRVSVEFDPLGFDVKDIRTRATILRCDSEGDLYPFIPATVAALLTTTADVWHRRLGHPSPSVFRNLSESYLHCNPTGVLSSICHACQLGKHTRLPFSSSQNNTTSAFEIIHTDLWQSPVPSVTGFKYYMLLLDDFTHYLWVFPLRAKSDVYHHLTTFIAYVKNHFNTTIKNVQCDNGTEYKNASLAEYFQKLGILYRFSCPYTSQQNGKAERCIRTINNTLRTLLFQGHLPPNMWVESLLMTTHLLNISPTTTLQNKTPHENLFHKQPTYSHLRVFGCLCYPNTSSTTPHKLSPRSSRCVFLGYPTDGRGFRCLDLSTHKIIISRHVTFDENTFPFADPLPPSTYNFLDTSDDDDLPPHHQQPPPPPKVTPLTPNISTNQPTPITGQQPNAILPPITPTDISDKSSIANPQQTPPASPTVVPLQTPPTPHSDTHQQTPITTTSSSPTPSPQQTSLPPTPPSDPESPPPRHHMQTRAKSGIFKPRQILNLSVTSPISPIPRTYRDALADPNWHNAMEEEFNALIRNNTWELVPRDIAPNVITGKWLFKHKFGPTGTLTRYKARWVVRGFNQRYGVDYSETFSPVIKPTTIRTVLSLALSRNWPITQLDVKNAFLHGQLSETVYCSQPSGFQHPSFPDQVCRLQKALYGLKQAPRSWYQRFASFIITLGFVSCKTDTSLFVLRKGAHSAYLLLYVDDIVLTASSNNILDSIVNSLSSEFAMTDLGPLHYFLGVAVRRTSSGLFLSQQQFIHEILERAEMHNCKPINTPVDTKGKLSETDGALFSDPGLYRTLAGALQYLTFTRPDISYAVQQLSLFMHAPRVPHFTAMKRLLRYLQGTRTKGLHLDSTSSTALTAYSDADWAGCPDSRRSTSGHCVFMGNNLISWSSKRQNTVSRSSAEAEYRGVANAVAEVSWVRNLLLELGISISGAHIVYCDNISAVYLSNNPVQHQRTKHIEVDIHFVRDKVALGHIRVLHVPAALQYADIFTKGLPTRLFLEFCDSLGIRHSPVSTEGAC